MDSGSITEPSEVFEFGDIREIHRTEWEALARHSGASYFSTPDWVLSWWRNLAGRPRSLVAMWRSSDDSLAAVAPMSLVKERLHRRLPVDVPVWVNSGSGMGAADHSCFPSIGGLESSIRAWIEALPGSVCLRNMSAEPGMSTHDLTVIEYTPTYSRSLVMDAPLIASRSMTKELRRKRRRLLESQVSLNVTIGGEIGEQLIDSLLELHARRFASMNKDSFFGMDRKAHLLELVEKSGVDRGPVIVHASHGEDVIGVDLGFRFGPRFLSYQAGWDPSYERFSVGMVLLYQSMEWALENGVESFDLLRGQTDYKDRIGVVESKDQTLLRARGLSGLGLGLKSRARRLARPS